MATVVTAKACIAAAAECRWLMPDIANTLQLAGSYPP